jgi:hemerythrin-like domain-containing protein
MTNRFVEATEKLDPSALQPMIGSHWRFYAVGLHHHHHIEDDSLFPALIAVRPELEGLVKTLAEDHRQLVSALDAVDVAITTFERAPEVANQRAMHGSIVAVREAFFPHLDKEDAEIIPAITQSIPPKEWDRLDKAALRSIPREYLPTAVGALDEVIRALPEQEQPPPPPPPIRLMLALSWRKKWSSWVKPLLV